MSTWGGNLLGGTLGAGGRTVASLANSAQPIGRARLQAGISDSNSHFSAMASDAQTSSYMPGQEQTMYSQGGDRFGKGANYQADMARWKALNSYAQNIGGEATAYGLFAGGMDAGPKPMEMTGMAMSGMLGSKASTAGHYFAPGNENGFYGMASGLSDDLRSKGSYESMHGIYGGMTQGSTPFTEYAHGVEGAVAATTFGNVGNDWNSTGAGAGSIPAWTTSQGNWDRGPNSVGDGHITGFLQDMVSEANDHNNSPAPSGSGDMGSSRFEP
jgi:hypothetical protein